MTADDGLLLAHVTVMRRAQRNAPEFEKPSQRFARPDGRS
jgi:hypothetical protein